MKSLENYYLEIEFKENLIIRIPLIKRIYTYLYRPEKIPDEYPNLIPHLHRDIRKKLGIETIDSEEYRSSRSYRSENDGKYISSDEEIETSSNSDSK